MSMRRNARFPLAAGFLALVAALAPVTASAQSTSEAESRTLYQRLGGLMPISVVVSDLVDALVTDPEINRNPAVDAARKQVPAPYLKFQVTAQVCQASGGPCKYTGRSMKEAHAHLNITEGEWQRMITLLKQTLAKHQVPARESRELLDIVNSTKPDIVAHP